MTKENVTGQATNLPVASDYSNLDVNDLKRKDNVEAAVQFINEKLNEYVYKGSVEIGDYVLKHFYNDSIELATSRNPNKPESYNKLCEDGRLAIDAKQLSVMVRVASQEKFFIKEKIDTTELSYTHKAYLLKVFNKEEKKDLIKKCIDKKLTSRELKKIIDKSESQHDNNLINITSKSVIKIDTILKFLGENNIDDKITELASMEKNEKKACIRKVAELKTKVDISISKLQKLSLNCDSILQ